MDRNILVYVDLLGTPHLVGRLWVRTRRDKEGATFQYADGWLANPIVLRTISRFFAGLASLALAPTTGGGQRSLAAIPRSV